MENFEIPPIRLAMTTGCFGQEGGRQTSRKEVRAMPGSCGTTEQQEPKTQQKEEKHPSSCGGGQSSCG